MKKIFSVGCAVGLMFLAASGSAWAATSKAEAQEEVVAAGKTLDKIVSAIKRDYSTKTIYVDGHTDADPITRTKEQWEDNWDLAAARANAVRRYLTSHGVDPHKVDLRSFGPNHPKKSKDASRRVEIVVQVS